LHETAAAAASNQPVRRERLIAGCRVALAALSLLAVWLDPLEPNRFVGFSHQLLSAYTAGAVLLALWLWRTSSPPALAAVAVAVHGVDLMVFFALIVATSGPASPFFAFLTFALVAGTLRWQTAGTLATGAAALAILLAAGAVATRLDPAVGFELGLFLIRSIYLAVLVVLLGQMARFEQRLRAGVATLAGLPAVRPDDAEAAVGALLAHAARGMRAPHAALAWEDDEEPWANLALWSEAGGLEWRREAPASLEPLAPAALAEVAFLAVGAPAASTFRVLTAAGTRLWAGDPAPPLLRQAARFGSMLSAPLRGESLRGRFFALDARDATADEIAVGALLAQQIAVQMDRLTWFGRFHREGLAEERIRLASDVHDGIVQSLAAAALRLETARQLVAQRPDDAAAMIETTQDLLVTEQRELREFLVDLAGDSTPTAEASSLPARLVRLRERLARHWQLETTIENLLTGEVPTALAQQVYQLLHETLVNASRHGRALSAAVTVAATAEELHLSVADDGCGFPFRGSFGFADLLALKLGPVSLKRRVTALGGRLAVASSEHGARVDIWLPVTWGRG
jgi:signal transduction histidine kinase